VTNTVSTKDKADYFLASSNHN